MTARTLLRFFVVTTLLLLADMVDAGTNGCPAGQAIQGIDFQTRKLVFVSTNTESAPVAWAHVNSDGTLDAANSKNASATSLYAPAGAALYYCIEVAMPFQNIQVTALFGSASVFADDPFTSCAPFSTGGLRSAVKGAVNAQSDTAQGGSDHDP